MSNPLHSIVCVSVMAPTWHALPSRALQTRLQDLQRRSAEHHRARGITGLLICGGGYFLAWLEGEESELRAEIDRSQQEERHTDLRVIHDSASDRLFAHWSLCVLNRPDAQDSVGRQLQWLLACESRHLQHWSPARMVRSAIKPPQLFQANQRVRRVGLFGASSLWISSFLAYLSSRWERPVVRTRVLHSDGLLSESVLEYMDVDHPSLGPLRWVNYSGGILESALMPLVVESLSMGLLFQTQRDADSVRTFNTSCLRHWVDQDPQTPVVAVVGRASLEHMPAVVQAFGDQGRNLALVQASMGDNTALWEALRTKLQHDFQARPPEPDPLFEEDIKTLRVPLPSSASASPPMAPPTALLPAVVAPSDFSVPSPKPTAPGMEPDWLSSLLEMGGVEAVSWRACDLTQTSGMDTGTRCWALRDPQGTNPVDWSAVLQAQEVTWAGLACLAEGGPLDQLLVRLANRLILSCHWPTQNGGVLSVITRSGWTNEMLLQTQLRDQRALLTPPAQATLA